MICFKHMIISSTANFLGQKKVKQLYYFFYLQARVKSLLMGNKIICNKTITTSNYYSNNYKQIEKTNYCMKIPDMFLKKFLRTLIQIVSMRLRKGGAQFINISFKVKLKSQVKFDIISN